MDDLRINNNLVIPAYVKASCLMIVRAHAPYRTGNLKYNGVVTGEWPNGFTIYIDEAIAKYGVYLDQWTTLGGWKHTQETKDKISKAMKGDKTLKGQNPKITPSPSLNRVTPKSMGGGKVKSLISGTIAHPNPHKGWFSVRAVNDVTQYIKENYNGRVIY